MFNLTAGEANIALSFSAMFNILLIFLLYRDSNTKSAWRQQLMAVMRTLQAIRVSYSEAIVRGESIKTPEARQVLRQTAYTLLGAEGQIMAMLEKMGGLVLPPGATIEDQWRAAQVDDNEDARKLGLPPVEER